MQRHISLRKIPYILIAVFWFITMAMLIIRHVGPAGIKLTPYESAVPQSLFEESWMGAYLKGEKIGYAHRKITEHHRRYAISETLKVRIKMMGVEKTIETTMDAETDQNFRLSSFLFKLHGDVPLEIKGRVEDNILIASVNAGGLTSVQTVPLKETPSLSLAMIPNILREGLKPGKKLSIPVIDPMTLTQEDMDIKVMGTDSIISMGKKQDAYKIKGIFKGIETYLWITEKGDVLREESPMGFVLVKEAKDQAVQLSKSSIDLITQIAIPVNALLPREAEYLKVRLSGVDLKGLELDGGRQTLKGDILEIKKENLTSPFTPKPFHLMDEYLKDTTFIQSKDPAIVSLAKDIVGSEKDMLRMTRLIHEWVYKNIEKVPTISMPMATEVLRTRQGDCNEHTTLFTALARAAGIPSRIAVGLTYKDGFFYYHAWPEVYLNEWVALDPTLGQFPADASHIRLLTGDIDKQLNLLTVIGRLNVEALAYR